MSQAKKNIKIICTIQNFLVQQRWKVLFCYHNLVFDELVVDTIKFSFRNEFDDNYQNETSELEKYENTQISDMCINSFTYHICTLMDHLWRGMYICMMKTEKRIIWHI